MNSVKKTFNKAKECVNKGYSKTITYWNKFIDLKYCKTIFKVLPQNIFLFILFIISIFTICSFYKTNSDIVLYNQYVSDSVVDPILTKPYDISFDDITLDNNPTNLCITFATYARTNHSEYKYVLYKGKDVVYEYQFNASVLGDGKQYCFDLPSVTSDNIKEYSASIIPIEVDGNNAITIYKNSISDKPTIKIIAHHNIFSIRNIIITIFIILFFVVNYLINKKKMKPEYFWLLISLVYLFAITIIIPPYEIPDEPVHYYQSYRLSQLDYTKSLYENIENDVIIMPESNSCIGYSGIQFRDKVTNFNDVLECLKETDNTSANYSYKSHSTKLGYVFSAIGIKIGDLLSNSPLIIFYSGRLFNLIVSILMVFFAIKITPKYKYTILSIATIPMLVQQMVSYSYDSVLNSCIILSFAVIMALIYNKKFNKYLAAVILLLCGAFITNIKFIYLPVMLFLFLIPSKNFKNKWIKYLYVIGVIAISYLLGQYLSQIFNNTGASIVSGIPSSENYNMNSVLSNPLSLFSIAFYTFKYLTALYLRGMFGYFSWFTFRFSDIIIVAFIVYYIWLFISEEKMAGKWYKKLLVWFGILFTVLGIFASMYFYWSKPGLGYVEGVQGRYLTPLLISIIPLLACNKKPNKINPKNVYIFINIMLLQYILMLLIFHY